MTGSCPECAEDVSPQVRLLAFWNEVLANGASAALPHNLTDDWLRELIKNVEEQDPPTLAVIAVIAIMADAGEGRFSSGVSKSDIALYVERYYVDLVCEEIYRLGGNFPCRSAFTTKSIGRAHRG